MIIHAIVGLAILAFIVMLVACSRQEKAERERRLRALELADIDNMGGLDFEHYLCRLFLHRGFQAEVTRASGDLGVDIVARRDGQKLAVQAKRYSKGVSRRAVSDAVAGKQHYGCDSAMVITNSYFTRGAEQLAESTDCELVDRDTLAEWILDYQQGERGIESPRAEPVAECSLGRLREALQAVLGCAGPCGQDWIDSAVPWAATVVVLLVVAWYVL